MLHYIHGGGWRVEQPAAGAAGDAGMDAEPVEQMVAAGFVVAASDYRYSGEATYPAAVEDTVDAVRWLRDNADRFGIDPSHVVLFGQSAGGYLAAAVGLGTDVDPVQGVPGRRMRKYPPRLWSSSSENSRGGGGPVRCSRTVDVR